MPLIIIARSLFGLISLALLPVAAYLVWSWWQGDLVTDLDGVQRRLRDEDWRLWVGLGLLAWSFLGRLLVTPLIAHGDDEPTWPERGVGEVRTLQSPSGASLYVELLGPTDGPTVILTHGWGLDSTIWFYAKRELSRRFRVIVWDLPGLGKSKAGAGEPSLEGFAVDLQTVLSLADGAPAVLVGHSIGGMTIQTLARDNPAALAGVGGIVLLNTTYTNPLRTMIASPLAQALRWPVLEPLMRLAAWLQPLTWLFAWQGYVSGSAHMANRLGFGHYVTRSQLEHTTLLATRNPPGVLARGNLAMFDWDATGALAKVRCPVLIIGGEVDLVTKLEASRFIADSAPSGRLEPVEGVNHMGFLERADVYNQAIADFVDTVQARPATETAGRPIPLAERRSFASSTPEPQDSPVTDTGEDRPGLTGRAPPP